MKKVKLVPWLVAGVGIDDAPAHIQVQDCQFYRTWYNMLYRCYKPSKKAYQDCDVAAEWHRFTTFKSWMASQDWEGKELDKDLLVKRNRTYGPEAYFLKEDKEETCGV